MPAYAGTITGAVEGQVDEVVLRRIGEAKGLAVDPIYITTGKPNLLRRLPGFNEAASRAPWWVLVDLNGDECPAALISDHLASPAPGMCLRVVVRAIEAWLIADAERLASFLSISAALVPRDPDSLPNPKQSMVNLASRSRRRAIREDMVPRTGSHRVVGPAYPARLIEFVIEEDWRPAVAARRSPSLDRCMRRIDAVLRDAAG